MDFSNFVPIIGTILSINQDSDCCSRMISMRTNSGIVNFVLSEMTFVVDSRQLRPGMRIAAFYDSNLPVPLIFPPQYRAQIIAVLGRNEQMMLNFFDRSLTATDNSLRLNIARTTSVETMNGQNFTCSPGNKALLVFYTETTRSIPPQTTPRKIVVMC